VTAGRVSEAAVASRHPGGEPLIEAVGLAAGYNGASVVRELDLTVMPGEVVALLGPNGAGKTTTLLTLSGALPALAGTVYLGGMPTTSRLHHRARRGLAFVTEERSVFMNLTVLENLRVGGVPPQRCFELFPELATRPNVAAGRLSGGEQQMLAVGRALGRLPHLLFADELSLGLGPMVVRRIMETLRVVADERQLGILLVEQHVAQALQVADRIMVLRQGQLVLSGPAAHYRDRLDEIQNAYLGQAKPVDAGPVG
jgi:branched-chain amino acid transport system ATP-binding protein